MATTSEMVSISLGQGQQVSGLLQLPSDALACYVFAHGAGAGMTHPFMAAVADGLAERRIASLRYQFPYMERGAKRPDPPQVAHTAVRAAVSQAARSAPGVALFAGGKSFGGRMTSQAQASEPLPGVRGLAFLGFPLHTAGRASDERAEHLRDVRIPLFFLQGTRDALADMSLMQPLVERLGAQATLKLFEDADHSFHVPARTGRKDSDVMQELTDSLAAWINRLLVG